MKTGWLVLALAVVVVGSQRADAATVQCGCDALNELSREVNELKEVIDGFKAVVPGQIYELLHTLDPDNYPTTTTEATTTTTTTEATTTTTTTTTTIPPPTLTCADINPPDRVNCGFGGITPQQCEENGCCWDQSVVGYPWCFQLTV